MGAAYARPLTRRQLSQDCLSTLQTVEAPVGDGGVAEPSHKVSVIVPSMIARGSPDYTPDNCGGPGPLALASYLAGELDAHLARRAGVN